MQAARPALPSAAAFEVKLVVFLGKKPDAFPAVAQALGVRGWESS